jgi:hypothetical protein
MFMSFDVAPVDRVMGAAKGRIQHCARRARQLNIELVSVTPPSSIFGANDEIHVLVMV